MVNLLVIACAALGTTAELSALHAPRPSPFTAATWNAYPVPLVEPVTVALVAVEAA